MSVVARLREAVAAHKGGATLKKAAKVAGLPIEDVRLAVLSPEYIDRFAIRIAEREANEPPKPARRARTRQPAPSTTPDTPKPRKTQKPASEPPKSVRVSRARAIKALGGDPPPFITPDAEHQLRRYARRQPKGDQLPVHELIAKAMAASAAAGRTVEVTVCPPRHADGALLWGKRVGERNRNGRTNSGDQGGNY